MQLNNAIYEEIVVWMLEAESWIETMLKHWL